MAPLLPRSSEKDGATLFSANNRERDFGILFACLIGVVLLLWFTTRLCGLDVCCARGHRRHGLRLHWREQRQEQRLQPQQEQQYMNPAHFMQLCARRDEQTRQKEKGLLTEIEIDIMAPLTAHRPAADVVVVAVAGRRGSADSASTGGSISKPTGAAIIVEPQPTIRPHRASRPPPGEGLAVCCVCLEGFGEEELLRATACSHVFHGPCLETWLMRYHSRCPLCQMNLKPNAK